MFERLAAQLREAREKKGLTQEALAKLIKMDLAYLRQMEAGDFGFLQELYVKAFLRAYAKAVGLNDEIALKKYALAVEGRNIDEVSFEPPVPAAPAAPQRTTTIKVPPVPQAAPPVVQPKPAEEPAAPTAPAPSKRTTSIKAPPVPQVIAPPVPVEPLPPKGKTVYPLPADLFDSLPPEEPVEEPVVMASPAEPIVPVAVPAPAVPVPTPVRTVAVPPIQYARAEPVSRFDDTLETPPRKKRQLNAMQKRVIIFAALSFLILVVVGIAIYESQVSKQIVVEGGSESSAADTGTSRYEEPVKPAATSTGDSLVLRMEFSDVCWVSVKPDSSGEVSENTFSKKSDPVEFKAAHKFLLNVGNAPGVRLLLNNKEVTFDKKGTGSSLRLEITKDTARVLPYAAVPTELKKKKK